MQEKRRWSGPDARSLLIETGLADPVEAITCLAQDVIDELATEPPFDPKILASFKDIIDVRQKTMMSAARLFPENGHLVVEVNADHTPEKQNFSVDHEITHTLIPTYSKGYIDDLDTGSFSDSSEEEYLCDVGASILLLDPRALKPRARAMGPSLYSLFQLATLFGASLQATARQLSSIDVWPCAFVFWEPGVRKAQETPVGQSFIPGLETFAAPPKKWRIKNPYVSPSFGPYPSKNKSVDDTSLVARAADDEDFTVGTEVFDLGGSTRLSLYCQNYFVPYRRASDIQPRIISILLTNSRLAEGERKPTDTRVTLSV